MAVSGLCISVAGAYLCNCRVYYIRCTAIGSVNMSSCGNMLASSDHGCINILDFTVYHGDCELSTIVWCIDSQKYCNTIECCGTTG